MTELTITAYGPAGAEIPLEQPVSLEIQGGLDSPAMNFSAEFPCAEEPPIIGRVKVLRGAESIFEGAVDRQTFHLSGKGRLLRLEARSRGALLLDNEAQPRTLWAANLSTAFARTAGKYDFALYNPNPSRTLAVYTVYKGMSEWDAFCGFARRMHNVTPYVEAGQIMVCGPIETKRIILANSGGYTPYLSLERTRSPYDVISRVYIRDGAGQYSSYVRNLNREAEGIRRERYIIPGTEFADNPGLDANQRIRASMYKYERVTVRCPGILRLYPGQPVSILDYPGLPYGMIIGSWRYLAGSSGVFTELELRDKDFY